MINPRFKPSLGAHQQYLVAINPAINYIWVTYIIVVFKELFILKMASELNAVLCIFLTGKTKNIMPEFTICMVYSSVP